MMGDSRSDSWIERITVSLHLWPLVQVDHDLLPPVAQELLLLSKLRNNLITPHLEPKPEKNPNCTHAHEY